MHPRRFTLALALAFGVTPLALPGQSISLATLTTDPTLQAGGTVRVLVGHRWIHGRVSTARGDTLDLILRPLRQVRSATLAPTSRLDLRSGSASRLRGALRGAAAGIVAGVLMGAAVGEAFRGTTRDDLMVAGYFLPYSVPLGIVVGTAVPGPRWVRVRITSRP